MSERILVISRHFWPEDYRVNDLCDRLSDRGFQIDVLCGQPSDGSGDFMKGYGFAKIRRETWHRMNLYRAVDVRRGTGSNISLFLDSVVFPITSCHEVKSLVRNDYSAVLIYQLSPVMMCRAGFRIGKQLQIPVCVYVARLWPQSLYSVLDVQSRLFKTFLDQLSMHYYQQADRLILPSYSMRRYFSDRLALPDDRLPVVFPTPDAAYEQSVRNVSLLEKLAGCFNLVMIGDFDGQISVDTVIRTADRIRQSSARNIRFVIIGDSEKICELKEQADRKGLSDLFYFEGGVPAEKIGSYLYAADALIGIIRPEIASDYAVPHQVINYLAAAKPLIISMGGAVRTLIRDAKCGFCSEPEDAEALCSNILKFYQMQPRERLQMGQNSLACQKEHYDRDKHADLIAAVLRGEEIPAEEDSESTVKRLWDL